MGVRRFQYSDGTLTPQGRKRYGGNTSEMEKRVENMLGKPVKHLVNSVRTQVTGKQYVDGYLAKEIDLVPCTASLEAWDIEEAGDDEPGWVDAQIAADEEMLGRRILRPREPQSYSAEE